MEALKSIYNPYEVGAVRYKPGVELTEKEMSSVLRTLPVPSIDSKISDFIVNLDESNDAYKVSSDRRYFISRHTLGKLIDEYTGRKRIWNFGAVVNGVDTQMNSMLTFKFLSPYYLRQDNNDRDFAINHFFKEVRVLARLNHPNIVRIHDLVAVEIEVRDQRVMKIYEKQITENSDRIITVPGYSMDTLYTPPIDLEVIQILKLAREIGSAIDYVHSQGVVILDLTDRSILSTHDLRKGPKEVIGNKFVLTDFGSAVTQETFGLVENSGTPNYFDPQILSSSNDKNEMLYMTDIHAFGEILYLFLNGGEISFEDKYGYGSSQHHSEDEYLSPLPVHIPDEVNTVLRTFTSYHRADRYPTCMDGVIALHHAFGYRL